MTLRKRAAGAGLEVFSNALDAEIFRTCNQDLNLEFRFQSNSRGSRNAQRHRLCSSPGVLVVTTRYVVVLVSVLCLFTTGAFAQDEAERMAKVLCAGNPECEALAKHRLTAETLRQMFAADRELLTLMKEVPDLERRMSELARSIDPERRLGQVTLSAQVHEGIPEIAQVLRRHNLSGRQYMFTYAVAMVTAMADDTLSYENQHAGRSEIPSESMTPALEFWRSMDAALKAEADAWKKMRGYDKGINR